MSDELKVFKALGDKTRLKIMRMLLSAGEVCVCKIMSSLKLNQAAVSKALGVLKRAGLVKKRRDGRWMHYSIVRGGGLASKVCGLIEADKKSKNKMRCM